MRTLTASLRLVHPPISNQQADILKKTKTDGAKQLKDRLAAPIYMIAQRQEIFLENVAFDEDSGIVNFELVLADKRLPGSVNAAGLSDLLGDPDVASMGVHVDDNAIFVLDIDENGKGKAVWGAGPDALLMYGWRNDPYVTLNGNIREFATYRLLYIGMSDNGAYQRLINSPHHARLSILTNEWQIRAEARVSDELYFFLFDIDPLLIQMWGPEDEITDQEMERLLSHNSGLPQDNLVCDVEKAFIRMLDTKYNDVKYQNYPRVEGGVFDLGFDSYAYAIAEDIRFEVQGQFVDGGYHFAMPASNDADIILVKGDEVSLIDVSKELKVDFPEQEVSDDE